MSASTKIPVPYFPPPPTYLNLGRHRKNVAAVKTTQVPQTLRRSRKFLLPSLLLLCFVATILSTIYAYCVASRHTRLTEADYASDPNAELNDSIFKRASDDSDSSSSPHLILILWSLTTPLATIFFILLELTVHIFRQDLRTSRLAHCLFLLLALLLTASWISTTILWGHCEILTSGKNLGICPSSLRDHFMFGIHDVSIAKATTAALIALGYVVHAYCIIKNLRDLRQFDVSGRRGLGIKHGDAQMVLEREMEEGLKVQKDLRRGFAQKARAKKDLKVRIVG